MKKLYTFALVGLIGVLLGSSIAKADSLFTKDLYYGIRGDSDVTQLQEFLTSQSAYSGPISGNFFSLTLAGVKQFQTMQGITPAAGYFGPLTRTKANAILSQQLQASNAQAFAETSSTPPIPTPPATTNDINNSLQAQLNALLQQVALLQKQLAAQNQTNQTLQQIQQNTAATPASTTAQVPTPPPTYIYITPPPSAPTPAPVPPPNPSDTIPPVISGVQAGNINTNSALITWTTNEYSDSVAYFGLSPGSYYSSSQGSVSALSSGYLHTVNLSSLSADTTYYYKVTSTDSSGNKGTSNEYSFTTAQLPPPPPPQPGSLTVTQNPAVGNQSFTRTATHQRVGSYSFRASSASLTGTPIDNEDTLAFSVLENIRPMIETVPLEQAGDAYARMMQGKARFRMVLTTGQ